MSASNRQLGQRLRRRYAGHFGVPIESVELIEIEADYPLPERCAVKAANLPAWTTCGPVPKWMEEQHSRARGDR